MMAADFDSAKSMLNASRHALLADGMCDYPNQWHNDPETAQGLLQNRPKGHERDRDRRRAVPNMIGAGMIGADHAKVRMRRAAGAVEQQHLHADWAERVSQL